MAEIGVKIKLEGAPQYQESMKNLTAQTKLYQAQVKSLQTQMGSSVSAFQKSMTMQKALSDQLVAQKNKAKLLEEQIAKNSEKYGENSTNVIRLKTQYQNLTADIASTEKQLKSMGGTLGAVGSAIQEVGNKMESVGKRISSVGDSISKKVTAPLVGIGAASVKSFADWESAFAGVMKTVDETATTTYKDISDGIRQMAKETASSKEAIAGVAEVAGQLGVSADDVLEFTKTMVMLGDSTNLSAEDAASSLAKVVNITGDSMKSIDQLGSAIVALGNNFATNESDIVEMTNRLASAGTIAGLSTTDILALSTAMSSVGIEAEAGGTAMTQTLTAISQAVENADAKLETMAQVAGTTAENFASTWNSNPTQALQMFIDGLSDMNAKGEETYGILDELGMSGVRQSNMLQSLALANDVLADAVDVSNQAYQDNTALTDEASKRYQTFNAQVSQTKERLTDIGIQIGEILMPYVQKFIDKIQELADWFSNLSSNQQEMIVKIGLIVAAIGPVLSIVGKVISTFGTITSGIGKLVAFLPTISGVISAVGAVITGTVLPAIGAVIAAVAPFLPVILGVAAAIAAVILVVKNWAEITAFAKEKWTELTEFLSSTWENISTMLSEAWEKFKLTMYNGIMGIVTNIKDIGTKIKNAFSNIMKNAYTWGADLLKNFINGIASKVSELIGKVKDVANTIKEYLHFSTGPDIGPLKDFNQWPRHMMQNYVKGIEASRYLVQDAVTDISADVALLENPFDTSEMYDAVRRGASDANMSLSIGDRELGRVLRDMGVVFSG